MLLLQQNMQSMQRSTVRINFQIWISNIVFNQDFVSFSLQRVERKLMKQREKIRQSNDARKQERKAKNDEIRIKYGKFDDNL